MQPPQDSVIVCSTARLARSLRLSHGRARKAAGDVQWQPLPALTLSQWLGNTVEQAILQGNILLEEVPRMVLNKAQELSLWERIIERSLVGDAAALFDTAGLARAAFEANQLMQEWNLAVPQQDASHDHAEEVVQFLQWRSEFRRQCHSAGWLENTRYLDWQVAQIQKNVGSLPGALFHAGFDRISPQQQRLFDALAARGTVVAPWPHLLENPASASQVSLDDCEAECRAAVAWVRDTLIANPGARLGIVAPELANLRQRITALLDDNLHPAAVSPAYAETDRSYDLSLGLALSQHPLVGTALDLLRLAANRHDVTQQDFSRVLLGAYWSSPHEADARAQLDARMRAHLPANTSLDRLLRFAKKQVEKGLPVPRLIDALQALLDALPQPSLRRLPSLWAEHIDALLTAAQWPGDRSLSSHEFQAGRAFGHALAALADFDALSIDGKSGPLSFSQAVQRLGQVCAEQIFQPESQDDPQLLVMGMLEAVATPLDAIWVMGMNDHVWPPPARPNPLLPASLQRAARTPNADGPVQAEFAQAIHHRLLRSAGDIVFSWSHKSGESELRVSPLMQGIAEYTQTTALAETLAEKLTPASSTDTRQWLDDHRAPAVDADEKISGGAGLIRAQAICPAWAYYRYRLGARPLEEPVEGLDSMDRGNLVHAVLQAFWQGYDSDYLNAMDDAQLRAAIIQAVEAGVAEFARKREEPLPVNFLALEKQRLQLLLAVWLAYEKERPPFTVEQCEKRESVDIAGLTVNLTLDRVDRLPDGRLIVIDYKTGSAVSHHSWADTRISEPQLPIYAALALSEADIAAVCFAQVRADEQRFVGIAADGDTLPGIKALQEATRIFPPDSFPDWIALVNHWKTSIEALAAELIAGEAAVVFRDEKQLGYCEVLPLLRLPERYLQLEAATRKGLPS